MPTNKPTPKTIQFPGLPAEGEAKLRGFLRTVGEFMGVTLEIQPITTLQVMEPADRNDVVIILNKALNAKKKELAEAEKKELAEAGKDGK